MYSGYSHTAGRPCVTHVTDFQEIKMPFTIRSKNTGTDVTLRDFVDRVQMDQILRHGLQ